jgi:hypothetical protein
MALNTQWLNLGSTLGAGLMDSAVVNAREHDHVTLAETAGERIGCPEFLLPKLAG